MENGKAERDIFYDTEKTCIIGSFYANIHKKLFIIHKDCDRINSNKYFTVNRGFLRQDIILRIIHIIY